jgi:hypothetical protein
MTEVVAVIHDERIDRDANVLHCEVKIGLLLKPRAPVGPKRLLATHFACGFVKAMHDVRRLEYNVLGVVREKPFDVMGVPCRLPSLRELQCEFSVHLARIRSEIGRVVDVFNRSRAPPQRGLGYMTLPQNAGSVARHDLV